MWEIELQIYNVDIMADGSVLNRDQYSLND